MDQTVRPSHQRDDRYSFTPTSTGGLNTGSPTTVLHLVGGNSTGGGVMDFARSVCRLSPPGFRPVIWKHTSFSPLPDKITYACHGRTGHTDRSLLADLTGAIKDLPPLLRWLAVNKPGFIHAHSRMGIVSAVLSSRFRRHPTIIHLHALAGRPALYRRIWQSSRSIPVFNSRRTCVHFGGFPGTVHIVPPCIEWPINPAISEPAIRATRFVAASSFVPIKRLDVIIQAFQSLDTGNQPVELHLYGYSDEPISDEYQQLVKNLTVQHQNIKIHRFRHDWRAELRDSDIFVHAATEESFGMVILEAFASGTRMVVPDQTFLDTFGPPLRDIGVFRAPSATVTTLAQAMRAALESPLRSAQLWQLRLKAENVFGIRAMQKNLASLYRSANNVGNR